MASQTHITIRAIKRKEPDLRKLARALIRQVLEEQRQAAAEQDSKTEPRKAS